MRNPVIIVVFLPSFFVRTAPQGGFSCAKAQFTCKNEAQISRTADLDAQSAGLALRGRMPRIKKVALNIFMFPNQSAKAGAK